MNDFEKKLKDAIVWNDIEFLEKHKNQYDINHRLVDEDNDSLLLYAISFKDSGAYKFFLDNGADITLINNEGEGILHSIVYSGVTERLLEFIKNYTFDINARSINGMTPLHLSTFIGKLEMAKILIEAGADVNIGDNECYTPLHDVAWNGNLEIVKSLLEHGANLHIRSEKGSYPLALAVDGDHEEVAKYLFSKFYPLPEKHASPPLGVVSFTTSS